MGKREYFALVYKCQTTRYVVHRCDTFERVTDHMQKQSVQILAIKCKKDARHITFLIHFCAFTISLFKLH